MQASARPRSARLPMLAATIACGLATTAWLVHPANQLGATRPTTVLASAALGLAAVGLITGALESRRSPRVASFAVIGSLLAAAGGFGALLLLMTLPHGS